MDVITVNFHADYDVAGGNFDSEMSASQSVFSSQMQGKAYILPKATSETLGGLKIGDGLTIDENGVVDVDITIPKNVSAFTNDVGYIPQSQLKTVTDDILEQAKQSGRFKGDKGDDGYTPVKGVDYFDGAKGADGHDGYTPVKGKDYFDGAKGEKGDDGYTPVKGVDYFDGAKGEDGHDYILTEKDKSDIAHIVINLIPRAEDGEF